MHRNHHHLLLFPDPFSRYRFSATFPPCNETIRTVHVRPAYHSLFIDDFHMLEAVEVKMHAVVSQRVVHLLFSNCTYNKLSLNGKTNYLPFFTKILDDSMQNLYGHLCVNLYVNYCSLQLLLRI